MTPSRPPRRLIVTADDFGADISVNDAVERAHRDGILTAASLMVAAPAAGDAVARARMLPNLGVGLHLVLVEGRPMLPPESLPDLVDADGLFRTDMARLGAAIFFRPRVRAQMRAEVAAQFEAFDRTGLRLDHVNAHKHFHLHPTIAGAIIDQAAKRGLKGARAPVEPLASLRAIEPVRASMAGRIAAPYARMVARRFARAGITVPDQVFGLAWSGALTTRRLAALIDVLPPGLTEIYTHPATLDSYPGSAPGYLYRAECAALTAPQILSQVKKAGIALGSFGDFTRD